MANEVTVPMSVNELEAGYREAVELLRQTRQLLRTTYGSKAGFAYEAQLHVLAVEHFLKGTE